MSLYGSRRNTRGVDGGCSLGAGSGAHPERANTLVGVLEFLMHFWFYTLGGGVAFVFETSQAINLGYKE